MGGFRDFGIWIIGWSVIVLSLLKMATISGTNGLQYLSSYFPSASSTLLWINSNFIYVWAIAGFVVYILFRPNNLFMTLLKKIVTLGKG